jgi:hypothetical protein
VSNVRLMIGASGELWGAMAIGPVCRMCDWRRLMIGCHLRHSKLDLESTEG